MWCNRIGILTIALFLSGCDNTNTNVRMGDVSVGQQMIDLKLALEQQAVTEDEYQRLKAQIMSLEEVCKHTQEEPAGA